MRIYRDFRALWAAAGRPDLPIKPFKWIPHIVCQHLLPLGLDGTKTMNQRLSHILRSLRTSLLVAPFVLPALAVAQQPVSGPQVYSVQHANVRDVVDQIEKTIAGVDSRAAVYADEKRQRIIVDGGPAVQRIALGMLKTIDRPAAAPVAAVANELAVEGYPVPARQLESLTIALKRQFPDARIGKDSRLNQVVVVAPKQTHQQISQWLGRQLGNTIQPATQPGAKRVMPVQPAVPNPITQAPRNVTITTEVVGLRHVHPTVLVQHLSFTLQGRGAVTESAGGALATIDLKHPDGAMKVAIDKVNRRVTLTGPQHLISSWKEVIAFMDERPAVAQEATRMVSLEQSEPADIRHALHLLRQASRVEQGVSSAAIPLGANGEPIIRVAAQQPGDGNQPPNPGEGEAGVGEDLDDLDSGLIGDVRIEFIPELGIIVLRGRERDVERVRRIIQQIETTADTVKPEIEIVYLRHLSNQSATALVVELYDQVFAPRQGPLSITALDKPNAILLIGGKQAMVVVRDLIDRLDQPVPASTQMKIFRLKHAAATEVQSSLANFFTDVPSADGGGGEPRPGLGTRGRIIADMRTNSLIVQAGPRDLQSIALLIQQIDSPDTELTRKIQIYRLQNTLADQLAPVLQAALRGESTTQGVGAGGAAGDAVVATPAGAAKMIIERLDAAQAIISSGILADVTVSADVTANTLIITSDKENFDLISELIHQLDQPPEAETQVKVFEVENGDATTMAGILQQLFGLQVTAGQGALGATLGQAFGVQAASAGESSLIPLRIVPETRTNSIIVSGTKGDLNVVEILMLRLDQDSADSRTMAVYKLMNAPALDIANTITTMLSSQRQLIQSQFQQNQFVSPYEQFESEIIVVPELVTNSLVVSATPQYYEQIIKIIKELDYQPPSVVVQCMICEVELSDEFEFGVELGLQDSLLFDRGVILGNATSLTNLTQGNLLAGQALSTFNMGRSSASSGYGGMVLSAGNESVNILVRAMQDAGRLQVLSRPSVMALNNQVAVVQVGALVPRITGTSQTPQGGVQNSTTDADVGLLLRIQPRINDDGLVVMIVDVERSDLGSIADGIPISVSDTGQVINSPQINTTTAQTTISAYSGQTVTFAGLIQKSRGVTSRRVPVLGDIPVVGRLFRFDAENQRRRELLIFLTPHVMYDKADTDMHNHIESERMSWCLSDIVEMDGVTGMSGGHGLWGPAMSPQMYPENNNGIGPTPADGYNGAMSHGGLQGEMIQGDGQGVPLQGHGPRIEQIPSSPSDRGGSGAAGADFGVRLPRILPALGQPIEANRSTIDGRRVNGNALGDYDPRAVRPVTYQPQENQANVPSNGFSIQRR
jgi:general secretion pathway protein D